MVLSFPYRILMLTLACFGVMASSAWGRYVPVPSSCDTPTLEVLPLLEFTRTRPVDAPWQREPGTLKIYNPAIREAINQVVLVPPLSGENFLDRHLARALCLRGIRVLILTYETVVPTVSFDLGIHDRRTEEFLSQLERALRTHSEPTTLVGASLGGMFSSVALGVALRRGVVPGYELSFYPEAIVRWVKSAAITVAGGPVWKIAATSQLDVVVAQRRLRMIAESLSQEEYERRLRIAIRLDPVLLADPDSSSRVLFFTGLRDDSVPTETQLELERAWGHPRGDAYSLGHPGTISWVYATQDDRIAAFVRR